MHLNHTIQTLT